MLPVRQAFGTEPVPDAGKLVLALRLNLQVPPALRGDCVKVAATLQEVMLASLHTYAKDEVREWLAKGAPQLVDGIAERLATPAPLGSAALVRDAKGRIADLPRRTDRLVSIEVNLTEGEDWRMEGAIMLAKKLPVH